VFEEKEERKTEKEKRTGIEKETEGRGGAMQEGGEGMKGKQSSVKKKLHRQQAAKQTSQSSKRVFDI